MGFECIICGRRSLANSEAFYVHSSGAFLVCVNIVGEPYLIISICSGNGMLFTLCNDAYLLIVFGTLFVDE